MALSAGRTIEVRQIQRRVETENWRVEGSAQTEERNNDHAEFFRSEGHARNGPIVACVSKDS